ncbi:hypothetical protein A2W12_00020 [Candidatus Nomurabacteria bacterium RBG_16_40_11]|nr:MAG: hypothetical protein A2W12_00020 [Candidatus Nomurabacteria bacterium RBG_16_40_11]OGI71907.1 MAG: hypothetical protein A2W56_02995 [Candidatus Nomurabacteria bacterium RIFCSPHIGHO2_02_41_18]
MLLGLNYRFPFVNTKEKRLARKTSVLNVRRTWNPLLAKRALQFSPKKSWEILLNSWDSATPATLTRASREPNFGLHTNWLPLYEEIRTFFQQNPDVE